MSSPSDKCANENAKQNCMLDEEEDMFIVADGDDFSYFDNDAWMQTNPYPPSLTTYLYQDEPLTEILNSIRDNTDPIDKALGEQESKRYSHTHFVSDEKGQNLRTISQNPNIDHYAKVEDVIGGSHSYNLDNKSNAKYGVPTEDKTRMPIEKARRAVAPTSYDLDEEPLLLYNPDREENSGLCITNKNEEPEQTEDFYTIKRNPFSVNHTEYIPVNGEEYQKQIFDDLCDSDIPFIPPTTFTDPSFTINFLPEIEDDDDDLSSWLCFDSDTELQEFKRDFEAKYEQLKQLEKTERGRAELTKTTLDELPYILDKELDMLFNQELDPTVTNIRNNKATCQLANKEIDPSLIPLKVPQSNDKVFYDDDGFIYSKRQRTP